MQELDEIYIDASNTLNVAMEGHALLLLTKVMRPLLTLLCSARPVLCLCLSVGLSGLIISPDSARPVLCLCLSVGLSGSVISSDSALLCSSGTLSLCGSFWLNYMF